MMSEGDRPRSSWQSWVRSSAARRATPEAPASASTSDDDLDVELSWGAAPEAPADAPETAEEAVRDDLDVDLSWETEATDEHPHVLTGSDEPAPDADDDEDGADDGEVVVDDDAFADHDGHDGDGELLPAVPLLPSIAGRVEALSGLLRSISMRVDGLTAVTDAYRANVTDRIDEYTETVLQLSRQSDQGLIEHRRANERAIGELRRSASDRTETLGQLVGRVDELATDMATLRELLSVLIDTMPASAEGSGNVPLSRADLDDRIDVIAEAVAARIDVDGIVDAVVSRMEAAFEVVSDDPGPAPAAAASTASATAASIADLLDAPPAAPEAEAPKRGRGRRKI